MTATTIICTTIMLSLIVSSLVIGFVTAFWRSKAFLLGAKPHGITILYKVSVCLCLGLALFISSPYGLLALAPGMIIGSTIAILDVVQMSDEERQVFLSKNRGRYSAPIEITDRTTPNFL